MRLKSLHTARATNQRLKTTYVGNMLMLPLFLCCLLSSEVWSYANIKQIQQQHSLVRQLGAAKAVNYDKDSSMTNLYHQPHFTGNRAVIVQLFEWKFLDIAEECRNFLGPQGYAGVQISPVLEHTIIKTSTLNHPWWERYEVISYRLASRSGDESDFWSMSRICNDQGVRIYADVVLNHMAAPLNYLLDDVNAGQNNKDFIVNTLLETNVNISQLNYSNVSYTQVDFHGSLCAVLSYTQDTHEIRNCQVNGHPDLDHSRAGVQKHIVEMLNKFIDMGVAGFRIDTAKYMWPIDLKNILKEVKNLSTEFNFKKNSRPFIYHDVFDLGLDSVSKTEYSTYGVVSEYLYPAELATIIQRKVPLSSLINWGPALGFLAHEDAIVFIDSHDTQRGLPKQLGNNQLLTHKQRLKYIMANVFMLIHPYGAIKRIMSSYYFEDKDINQGPPAEDEEGDQIRSPQFNEQQQCTKDSGWVCEHRWPVLISMLKVANYFNTPGQEEQSIIYFQTNGANQVAFCRGYKAFVAINNEPEMEFEKEVYACLKPGTYCDMVTGGKKEGEEKCHGKMVIINKQGYTKLKLAVADAEKGVDEEDNEGDEGNEEESGRIESYGIMVIYVESKIEPKEGAEANNKEEEEVDDLQEQENNEETPSEAEVKEGGEADENMEQPIEDAETSKGEGESNENKTDEKEADDAEAGGDDEEENEADDAETEGDDVENADVEEADANSDNAEGKGEEPETSKDEKVEEDENQPNEDEEDDAKAEDDANEEEDTKAEEDAKTEDADVEEANTAGDDTEGNDHEEEGEANDDDGNPNEDEEVEPEEINAKQVLKSEEEAGENAVDENDEGEEDNSNNKEDGEDSKSEEKNDEETAPKSEEADVTDDLPMEEDNNEMEGDGKEIEIEETAANLNEETDDKSKKEVPNNEENHDEIPVNDQPPEEQGAIANSLEILTDETAVEEPETAESRNLDDKASEAEEQMEKPIAEIVDESSEAADMVTARIQDVQAAGIFVKPKGDDNNG